MLFDDPNKFSNDEIRKKLLAANVPRSLIDSVISQYWFHDWGNSFIAFPRHAEFLQAYLVKTKANIFSRFDFYSFFFKTAVSDFEKNRKTLQQIALVFELMHTDQMSLSEFEDLLKEIKAPSQLTLVYFKNNQLVSDVSEKGKRTVKWLHHTLTEYLAADYILSQKDPISTSGKFMIYDNPGLTTLKPSWNGVLRFLLEQNPELFVGWVLDFVSKYPDSLNDNLAEILVSTTPVSIEPTLKTRLFRFIFDSYQKRKSWIPVWARLHLYKFIVPETYKELKGNVDAESYVHRGNIAATVGGMLQNNHELMTAGERKHWKEKLIAYANDKNDNGVLQRNSLDVLENYTGETDIISRVAINAESSDSLVREAFIRMCQKADPNHPESVRFFVQAIADDRAHIYARNALYDITSAPGVKTLLRHFAESPKLIHQFLDKESIFNKEDVHADEKLIYHIRKVLDDEIVTLAIKIIIEALSGDRNYDAGNSYFIRQLAMMIMSRQKDYIYKFTKQIKSLDPEKKDHLFINDVEGIFAVLLTPDDIESLQKILTPDLHRHAPFVLQQAIWQAVQGGNADGEEILQRGIALGITQDMRNTPAVDYQKKREWDTYRQFQQYLSPPEKGQYFPDVFRMYAQSREVIEKYWSQAEKKRLIDLAIESNLDKIDPEKIKVRYKNQASKSGQYTISSIAAYFPQVLKVIQMLEPSVLQRSSNRQKVVNYIPFAYSSEIELIEKIVGEPTDEELATVNIIMTDRNNDARYLVPQTYIYFAGMWKKPTSPKKVLLSLVTDSLISELDRRYALKNLKNYLSVSNTPDISFLKKLEEKRESNSEDERQLAEIANAHLVAVFKNPDSIDWRFGEIKKRARPYERPESGWSDGADFANEIDLYAFAEPLIELNDERYLDRFIDLLDFSLTVIDKRDYWEYVNYLWRIVIAFVVRDDYILSVSLIETLRKWGQTHSDRENTNWFAKRLDNAVEKAGSNFGKYYNAHDSLRMINK